MPLLIPISTDQSLSEQEFSREVCYKSSKRKGDNRQFYMLLYIPDWDLTKAVFRVMIDDTIHLETKDRKEASDSYDELY